MNMNIPFLDFGPQHKAIELQIEEAFKRVFKSNWFIMGQELKKFESEYADFSKTNHCIGVSNGLDALTIALLSLGIGQGDEVIVPSNTYIATAFAVTNAGATPVFAEPDRQTYNLSPATFKAAITPKTKAVMPVHLYGQACEMEAIMEIAKANKIFVIEDNAQAHGACFNDKITGSWGHMNGTSFYPGKNLGALGDAGAITTNDASLAEKAAVIRNYGSKVKYENEVVGYNMRLDEIQAAFLSIKLQHLMEWTRQRQEIAHWYDEQLGDIEEITIPFIHPNATHSYHLYVIRCKERDKLQAHLQQNGIGTLIHYPIPPHQQKAYSFMNIPTDAYPIANELASTSLSLPLWPGMTSAQVEEVAKVIRSFYHER